MIAIRWLIITWLKYTNNTTDNNNNMYDNTNHINMINNISNMIITTAHKW